VNEAPGLDEHKARTCGGCAQWRGRRACRSSCQAAGPGQCRGTGTCGRCAFWARQRWGHLPLPI